MRAVPGGGGPVTGDRLLLAHEVAELLNVPVSWVRSATRAGTLPAVRVGRWVRYDRADIDRWIDEQKRGGPGIRRAS